MNAAARDRVLMIRKRVPGVALPRMKKWQLLAREDPANQSRMERRDLDWNETAPHPKAMAAITCDRRKRLINDASGMVLVADNLLFYSGYRLPDGADHQP